MRNLSSASTVAVIFGLLALAACGDPKPTPATDLGVSDARVPESGIDSGPLADLGVDAGAEFVPPFRNPVALPDAELAMQALRILGAPEAGATAVVCNECHSVTRARVAQWRILSTASLDSCLTDLDVPSDASATATLACLREGRTAYRASSLGIWATAAHLPWFQYVFRHGTPASGGAAAHATFLTAAGMPRNPDTRLTQPQFDIVAEWFIRGTPNVDDILPISGAPTECLPYVSTEARTHIAALATTGWAAKNAAAGMLSYGCAGATTAADCLVADRLARTTTFGREWETISDGVPSAHLRVLHTTDYQSSYWTRSSPDGRFVSHGASDAPNLRFIDLQEDRVFGGDGRYDTSFFPDGSGFAIQGGSGGAHVCESRVLTTGTPTMLDFTEPGCTSSIGIGLYEHLGTSLDGGDFWAISGTATYDDGGHDATLEDPIADFPASSSDTITRMLNTGTGFVSGGDFELAHPYQGDGVISPSFTSLITRQAGRTGQLGYVLHALEVTGSAGSYSVTARETARYCLPGAKAAFSYDERWLVTHHYVLNSDAVRLGFSGPADPRFAAYRAQGAANIYLVDLTTGTEYRVTNMAPGQYALFPHFRSDGWIYFIVREAGSVPEYIVAGDAALLAAAL